MAARIMGARTCIASMYPEEDIGLRPHRVIEPSIRLQNCGNETGEFYAEIALREGGRSVSYTQTLDPNELGATLKTALTMPNHKVRLDFYGGRVKGTLRYEDFHYTVFVIPIETVTFHSVPSGASFKISVRRE